MNGLQGRTCALVLPLQITMNERLNSAKSNGNKGGFMATHNAVIKCKRLLTVVNNG
ncbi:hypothetical protein MMIC_P0235 [Mariprofundus micogutta]|uniref:Uncharacterized protein n=1 Tax=Mariprofundus micogutta TaxID=1921010 RepID=A0A1L8CK81_9PROT|nr:hypothetical protein MMIC_P0235 [Mariprofundus micogutta]